MNTGTTPSAPPPLYLIMFPGWTTHASNPNNWCVLKRNQHREMEKVTETTSYDSARAVIPEGLMKTGTVFEIEFWEQSHPL
jgi:hypothetical protein